MAEIDLRNTAPRDAFQLITRVVAPRPIAMVSTGVEGRFNVAPFSYFMMGGSNPPSCAICPVNTRDGKVKDTIRNLQDHGEFVINVCTYDYVEQMNQCSYPYPHGVDEFEQSGLTKQPSQLVAPPRVKESPIQLECKVFQLMSHGSGPLASTYVIGEILHLHVDDELMVEGLPDATRMELVARLGGETYARITPECLFDLSRPSD